MQKTVAKINLKAIQHNARVFRAVTKTKLCAVVKANAYGHGAEEVAASLSGIADCFAVALIEEGIAVRDFTAGKDILVFTPPTSKEEALTIAQNGFIATVSGEQSARLMIETARKYRLPCRVHLKVNLGMNRYGVRPSALARLCRLLKGKSGVFVEGLYGHLHIHTKEKAELSRQEFLKAKSIVKRFFSPLCCHLSATYGACLGKEFSFDMVRVGIGLYGYLAENATSREEFFIKNRLKKAMRVYAKIVASRKYTLGGAGYGERTVTAKHLSVLRLGYADGFLRKRENGIKGSERTLNELCMDVCIKNGRYRVGESLVVMADAEKTAAKTGTISYEVLCAATRRSEFIYLYE